MTPDDLTEAAAPRCGCGEPIVRTEIPFVPAGTGEWRPVGTMVCPAGHRTPVKVLEND